MSEPAKLPPIAIRVSVSDPTLADRVTTLLSGIAELRWAGADEPADIEIITFGAPRSLAAAREHGAPWRGPEEASVRAVGMTPREFQVLTLLAEGASNKTIARQLGISVHTAKFHVGSLLDKLDATGRTDAVAHAARIGVLHL